MVGWLIALAYLVIAGWTFKKAALRLMDREAARELAKRDEDSWYRQRYAGKPLVVDLAREEAYILGSFAGPLWPLYWPGLALLSVFRASTNNWETPTERMAKEREELKNLRKLAKEHGLNLPEER